MRQRILLVALALTFGCQGPTSVPDKGKKPVGAKASTSPKAVGGRLPLAEVPRTVDLTGKAKLAPIDLTGTARLISDKGLGILSNNSGSLISDKGGALIGNNGSGLISDNGGAVVGQNGASVVGQNGATFAVLQAAAKAPRAESILAEAEIEVLDAAGRLLVGADGKAIATRTDKSGDYAFKAELPAENLILRIRLNAALTANSTTGQLFAVLPKEQRTGALDLDTASSFGTRYVLDTYVNGAQATFDRLPASEADALRREIEAARGLLGDQAPTYAPADQVAALEALRAQAPALSQRLETIKALLLAGQANLGAGLQATKVAFSLPTGVVGDAAGNLYVSELASFRVRKIAKDGTVSNFAGTGARDAAGKAQGQTLEAVSAMAIGPDGALYLTQSLTGQIRRIAPDGTMSAVVDGVSNAADPIRFPGAVAAGSDGTLYVGETVRSGDAVGRVLSVKDGKITDVTPANAAKGGSGRMAWPGVGVAADGALYALEQKSGVLWRRPAGQAWAELAALTGTTQLTRLHVEADGSVLVSCTSAHQVLRVTPDGKSVAIAGNGQAGQAGDGGPATAARIGQPSGVWRAPDGNLFIADGDGYVRKVAPDGIISTIAGTSGILEGDALALAVNNPGGLAIDPQGRVVFAEAGSSTIKRIEDRRLTTLAGTFAGYAGDGGPATAAQFANPAGIAYAPDGSLFVVDVFNRAIRKIDPQGTVTTLLTEAGKAVSKEKGPFPAGLVPMNEPLACAVSPTGLVYWSDAKSHQVYRQRADGLAEVVAGTWDTAGDPEDGVAARDTKIHTPFQLSFDPQGNLYLAAFGNSRILRIAGGEPTSPIETVVGLTPDKFVGRLISGGFGNDEGAAATEAMLLGVTAFALDPKGGMLVAELGTAKLTSFGAASVGAASGIPPELIQLFPSSGCRIRRVAADGTIKTVAGDGTRVLNDPTTDDFVLYPLNLALDPQGGLVIADSALNQIKLLPAGSF